MFAALVSFAVVSVACAIFVAVYFIPTICAFRVGQKHRGLISFLNLLFGWSLIGWVVCLVWALVGPRDLKTASIS